MADAANDETGGGDVAARPNEAADAPEIVARYVPADVLARYEVFSYRNAALNLSEAHPVEFGELMDAMRGFRLTRAIIAKPGGSESEVPKAFSTLLRPHGWQETTIQGYPAKYYFAGTPRPICSSSCSGARRRMGGKGRSQ